MTTPTDEPAEDAQRRTQATTMRLAGAEYAQIARALRYPDTETCRADVAHALEQRVRELEDVNVEVARLNRLQTGLWTAASNGDTKAAQLVLTIINRRLELTRPASRPLRHSYEPGCDPGSDLQGA